MDITGSIAVTGAGGGLGLGIALDCLSRGCDVLALILDEEQRSGLEAASVGLGGNLKIEILDITKPGNFSFPDDLDVLVNNAGIRLKNLPIEHIPLDEWRLYMEVNLLGAVELTCRALPQMKRRGKGLICNINSGSLYSPMPFLGPYRAAKAALAAFSETLRAEVGQFGIEVLEILPGAVRTGINKESVTVRIAHAADYPDYEPMARRQRDMFTQGDFRICEVEDAARCILDAINDNKGRMRHGTDPGSNAAMDAWRPKGGEDDIAAFIRRLTPVDR